jgi:prepilin-type N-terminal cleavage/methylation domain-containing protein/prepilin-type processing-associated H-X9-DG protein
VGESDDSQDSPRERGGFSLVELLVVIAIIALLLSILTPALAKARIMALRLKCAHNLKQINLAVLLYLDGNNDTYPCAQDPVSGDPSNPYWLWMGRGWRGFVEPYLGGHIDANNPSVLFCPQDPIAKRDFESTSYGYSMSFYHSPEQIDNITSTGYTYDIPGTASVAEPAIRQRSPDVARPAGKILIGEWFSNHLPVEGDGGWWDWRGSRNYLFADGQVLFLEAVQIREANDGKPNPNLTNHGIKGVDWPRF